MPLWKSKKIQTLSWSPKIMSKIEVINSPCVGVCQYNNEEVCSGCFRTVEEISQWTKISEEEREKIMSQLDDRIEKLF